MYLFTYVSPPKNTGDCDITLSSTFTDLTPLGVLTEQKDPRVLGTGDLFDSYPRFGKMRPFPGFNTQGQYNPAFIQRQKQKE